MNVLHRDCTALGAGNCLFGHEYDVVRFCVWFCIFFDDVTYIIFIGDNVGADRKTLIFDTVYLDDLVFPFVYDIAFFAHVLQSFQGLENHRLSK